MSDQTATFPAWLTTALRLGRVASLPTVWSNCLAAWLLGGAGRPAEFFAVALGASMVYLGRTFLNDYLDAGDDHQPPPRRPVALGRMPPRVVLSLGLTGLVLGAAWLMGVGGAHPLPVGILLVAVVVHDRVHQATTWSTLLLGLSHFLLYIAVASAAREGVAGLAVWGGLAMGCYAGGVACLTQRRNARGPVDRWPLALMTAPVGLAIVANAEEYREVAAWLTLLLALWVLASLRHALRANEPNVGLAASGLIAGIVLVDLLLVCGHSPGVAVAFLLLFLLTIAVQRYGPGT